MITDRKIRMAVVGTGRIAGKHLHAIAEHSEDLELVAVCDSVASAMEREDIPAGTPRYEDLATMLSEVRPDLVSICTPHSLTNNLMTSVALPCAAACNELKPELGRHNKASTPSERSRRTVDVRFSKAASSSG